MNNFFRLPILICILALLAGVFPGAGSGEDAYYSITGPCNPRFPQDHGPHTGYHTEWWYYTGNLHSNGGERYGFQLTFFRSRLNPPGKEKMWQEEHGSSKSSAWRTQQVFLAHVAITDIGSGRFYHKEQMARGALDLAGAHQEADTTTVFVKNWSARLDPLEHALTASTEDFEFRLILSPRKEPVPHGERGYSLKGTKPESASCYYSFTRLGVEGALKIKGKEIPVHGESWMDHEFSSAPLESDVTGWDWLGIQLADNTELMIYLMRSKDGTYSPASAGTFVDASGKSVRLAKDAFTVDALDHWTSPHSGGRYPSRWRVRIPSLDLNLTLRPNVEDQEMQTQETTRVTYWEGSVSASGTVGQQPVEGQGYVELTGYAAPLDAPM